MKGSGNKNRTVSEPLLPSHGTNGHLQPNKAHSFSTTGSEQLLTEHAQYNMIPPKSEVRFITDWLFIYNMIESWIVGGGTPLSYDYLEETG